MAELYRHKCKCGRKFYNESKRAYLCPYCKGENKKEKQQRNKEACKKPLSIRHCHYCGVEFEGTNQLYCPMCRNMDRKEQQGQPNEALHKMNALCELYNKNHGTHYSYGQFVSGLHTGKIKIGVVKNE